MVAQAVDYSNLPAGAPPLGVKSNFDHAKSRAIDAHVTMGIFIVLTTIFVLLRVYVKLAVTHMWGWDDCACILGFLLIIGHDAISFHGMGPAKWLGRHIWDIRVTSITKSALQSSLATINLYAASAFFVKLSLFLLYLRLFKPNKVTRWLIYLGILVCGIFYSASIISNCVLCIPRPGEGSDEFAWSMRGQKCSAPSQHLAVVQAVFSTLSDLYLVIIPIGSVFQLHLPAQKKLGVSAIFMVGIIAIICSLGSLGYRIKLLRIKDSTWFSVSIYIFSAAEVSAGIICSCIPILASLFRGGQTSASENGFLGFSSLQKYLSSRFSSRSPSFAIWDQTHSSRGKLHSSNTPEILYLGKRERENCLEEEKVLQ